MGATVFVSISDSGVNPLSTKGLGCCFELNAPNPDSLALLGDSASSLRSLIDSFLLKLVKVSSVFATKNPSDIQII